MSRGRDDFGDDEFDDEYDDEYDDDEYDDDEDDDDDEEDDRYAKYNRYSWNYYSANNPRKVVGGLKIKNERGVIGTTWWSKRWLKALEAMGMGTRLSRGRSYARQGQVVSIDIEPGLVKARVQGSMREPYKIRIQLEPLSARDWEQVTDAMAAQAIFAAKLLTGEMPTNIEDAFNAVHLSLFPVARTDLHTDCSCPDYANPCKHIAAVYYILAEQFDEDPFLIFKLRGRSKEEIIATLRQKRAATISTEQAEVSTDEQAAERVDETPLQLEAYLDTFWRAGEALETFVVKPQAPEMGEAAILKRLGDAPYSVEGHNLTKLLRKAYNEVGPSVDRKLSR